MSNILRGSRVKRSSKRANDFISSIGFDLPIAKHVVAINMAHMLALSRSKEVTPAVASACLAFLDSLPRDVELDPETEDVHHAVEQQAVRAIGIETAGFLNFGKSRNDQVATAIRMQARVRLLDLGAALARVQEAIILQMRRHKAAIMPGYTHLQHAQPVTLAHHLQAYFDALQRDVARVEEAYSCVNKSPMGAAALAGTSVRVDREYVAALLGFDGLVENAMDAVSSRDFALQSASAAAIAMVNLSRLAEELILWSSIEFGFVELGDEYSATSSIMPQKKNPVVAETIRAKCGSVIGGLTSMLAIAKALPNSYNLDLQEVTPHLWRALDDATESASLMAEMLSSARFDEDALQRSLSTDMSTATELANHLVVKYHVPFRQAHAIVGELVRSALERKAPLEATAAEQMAKVSTRITGKPVKIDKHEFQSVLDALKTLKLIRSAGGSNPLSVSRLLLKDAKSAEQNSSWLAAARCALGQADERLQKQVRANKNEVRT
ncbi:MAG: argininosuccinate lyase [Nitrososphaerota archaeon]|nr:argininosuccinate lyase [Nitrososphaerota archaeon]